VIRRQLEDEQPKRFNHRIGLYGLGGVGKTQIAIEYCFRYGFEYNCVFWISAMTESSLFFGFSDIATAIGLSEVAQNMPAGVIARAVLRWFGANRNWLLVIDNLDDISIVDGYLPDSVGHNGAGHVLITTRNPNIQDIPAEGIEIPTMTNEEAATFLLCRVASVLDDKHEVEIVAKKIAAELGYLPLALEQAAGYILHSGNISKFLDTFLLPRNRKYLFARGGNHMYPGSLAATFRLSINAVQRTNPNSIRLLQLLAFLNPDEVLVDFLKAGTSGLEPKLKDIIDNESDFSSCLHVLETFSLIRVQASGAKIRMHRLIQAFIIDELDARADAMILQIIRLGNAAFPDWKNGMNRETCRKYHLQVMACLGKVDFGYRSGNDAIIEWQLLAERVVTYLLNAGFYLDSRALSDSLVQVRVVLLGKKHPDTLRSMYGLAEAYQWGGRLRDAAVLHEEILTNRKEVLGPVHPESLKSMYGLSEAYFSLGRVKEARSLQEETLELMTQVLGEKHPDTLMTTNGLAATYQALGQADQAAKLYESTLEIMSRVLGQEHPDTLMTMQGVAEVYQALGRVSEAVNLFEKTLGIMVRVLGQEHPDTLIIMNGVAGGYQKLGQGAESVSLFEKTLQIMLKVLGQEHPDTLIAMNGLAGAYQSVGKVTAAASLYENILEISNQTFGEEHPETLNIMNGLAAAFQALGKETEAAKFHEILVERRTKVLGLEHPDTMKSVGDLASAYSRLGQTEAVAELIMQQLQIRTQRQSS
jgi:tetratricopeptide (TPR) repeat protein